MMLKLHINTLIDKKTNTFIKSSHLFSTVNFSLNKAFRTNNPQYHILLKWVTRNCTAIDWQPKLMKHIFTWPRGRKGNICFYLKRLLRAPFLSMYCLQEKDDYIIDLLPAPQHYITVHQSERWSFRRAVPAEVIGQILTCCWDTNFPSYFSHNACHLYIQKKNAITK